MGIVNIYIAKLSVKEYLHAIRIPALFILAGSIAAGTGVSKKYKVYAAWILDLHICMLQKRV